MNDKTSQVNRLLAHFNGGGTVTSFEAYERFGITQLGARIKELETRGVAVGRSPVHHNGKRYVRYSLVGHVDLGGWYEH